MNKGPLFVVITIGAIIFLIVTVLIQTRAERLTASGNQSFRWMPLSDDHNPLLAVGRAQLFFDSKPFPHGVDLPSLVLSETAEGSSTPYAKDKNHVYYLDASELGWQEEIPDIQDADPETFNPLYSYSGPYGYIAYAKDGKHFFSGPNARNSTLINFDTFKIMLDHYGRGQFWAIDKNHVYDIYASLQAPFIVSVADPSTFALILTNDGHYTEYAEDKNHVFYFDTHQDVTLIVPGAYPSSFAAVSGTQFDAVDRGHEYFDGKLIQ
jgi:hypothetical protein